MNEKIFEEDLSISYLRAIAAKAQVEVEVKRRDSSSKDVELSKEVTTDAGNQFIVNLYVQLKTTYSRHEYKEKDDIIKYKLKSKNYNDLCKPSTNLTILALLILPKDKAEWVIQTEEELKVKHCMYWLYLKNKKFSKCVSSVTVDIPKRQILSAETLNKIFYDIANKGTI